LRRSANRAIKGNPVIQMTSWSTSSFIMNLWSS